MANPTTVNSMYPLDYFSLANVKRIKYPDQSWWSSHQRFASVDPNEPTKYLSTDDGGALTSEYLEIDLGRIREINYINFQVMRSPVNLQIEYDPVSADDGTHSWVAVNRVADMPYDNVVHFDPDARNAWFNAQFYFTDAQTNLVSTRFLRLRFVRRAHPWPTKTSAPFRWPISVKNLRTARYIATLADTHGPLINTGAGDTEISLDIDPQNETYEIRQRFTMPDDYQRSDISPSMMGFSFETRGPSAIAFGDSGAGPVSIDDMAWKWTLLDVTNPAQSETILTGVIDGATNDDRAWINVFFDPAEPVDPDPAKTYELRLRSLNADAASSVFAVSYNTTSPMPGGHESQQVHSDGTIQTLTSKCLSLRVWGDVAETGTDVLGNRYRYGIRRDNASNVYDNTRVGWMCEPQPSAEAVESLYFDVRVADPTNPSRKIPSVIDAFSVSPQTQGVRMHLYYTDHGLSHDKPHDRDDWDNLIWTPISVTYTLRGNQIIELPQAIRTTFIKLEFSRLQPQPFRLPAYPKLPVKEYRRYPTWVEEQFQNTQFKRTINDWFVKNLTPRRRQVLKELSDPVLEFKYEEREFLAALSTGDIAKRFANNQFVDLKDKALVDPVTGSKLFLDDGALYRGTLTANVDRDSVLGQLVADRFDPTVPNTVVESVLNRSAPKAPRVSTSNDRISQAFSFLAATPMWFNRRCRHHYKIERAGFNKQAYFVGVNSVQFFRKDYTTRRDDTLILDNLHDDHNLADNTFQFDNSSSIWRSLPPYQTQNQEGLTLYVTYSVNPTYTDEPITFYTPSPSPGSHVSDPADTQPITLLGTGGAAYNITVASQPGGEGVIYQPGTDYDISYSTDPNTGETTNIISVSTLSSRAVASIFTRQIDAESVVGRAIISGLEEYILASQSYETAVMTGVAKPSATSFFTGLDAAISTGVAAVRQSGFGDAALVIGAADQTTLANSFEQYIAFGGTSHNDSFTVTGVAVETQIDSHGYTEAATAAGAMSTTFSAGAINTTDYLDPFQFGATTDNGTGLAMHQGQGLSNLVDTQALYATAPDAHMHSIWVRWASLQPTGPADFSGFSSVTSTGHTIDDSFDHAKAHGYKVVIRVSCGCDAPSWLYDPAVVGTPAVTELKLIANDGDLGPISVPLPWDAKLRTYYEGMLDLLAAKLDPVAASGVTAGGTRRSDYGYFIAVSMPTEVGTEMTLGYGSAPTYLGAATLFGPASSGGAAAIGATTDTSIRLQGTVTGYVAPMLLKIDSELMFCTAFDAATKIATVVRGFSGSTTAGHNPNALVTYADQTTTAAGIWPVGAGTTGVYNGVTGIFENQTLNASIWLGGGRSLVSNQTNAKQAWYDAINSMVNHFCLPTGIPCTVAIGAIFADKYVAAIEIASAVGSSVVWIITTNLQPGRITTVAQQTAAQAGGESPANINDPTRFDKSGVQWPTYYEAWNPSVVQAIRGATVNGGIVGFQVAANKIWNTFNSPYAGAAAAWRLTLEEALAVFNPVFIEMNTSQAITNNPPTAPSTDTTYHYLFGV